VEFELEQLKKFPIEKLAEAIAINLLEDQKKNFIVQLNHFENMIKDFEKDIKEFQTQINFLKQKLVP